MTRPGLRGLRLGGRPNRRGEGRAARKHGGARAEGVDRGRGRGAARRRAQQPLGRRPWFGGVFADRAGAAGA